VCALLGEFSHLEMPLHQEVPSHAGNYLFHCAVFVQYYRHFQAQQR
jgi:hypothetical protein